VGPFVLHTLVRAAGHRTSAAEADITAIGSCHDDASATVVWTAGLLSDAQLAPA